MDNNRVFHLDVWFVGHVQGVGFRYQTLSLAKGFNVCGTVENLPDGRVYLSVEGSKDEVDAYVRDICEQMESFIHNVEKRSEVRIPQHKGFRIC